MNNNLNIKKSTRIKFWSHFIKNYYKYRGTAGDFGPEKVSLKRKIHENRILHESEKFGDGVETEVPSYNKNEISIEDFKEKYLFKNRPVLLKGFGKDFEACKKWNLDFFENNYGNEIVPCRQNGKTLSNETLLLKDVTIRELVKDIKNGGSLFGSNLSDFLNENESLKSDINLQEFEKYICFRKRDKIASTQLFMSGGNTKTGFHASGGVNLFYQIYGVKKWTFVNPDYTPWMYPVLRKDLFYTGSKIPWTNPASDIAKSGFPLYNYVPKQVAVLEPGDILFSPQWWWHAIETRSSSIAVASRAMNKMILGSTPFSLMWVTSKEFRALVKSIITTGVATDKTGGALIAFDKKSEI
ncbi:MAG: hypothetical protein COA79_23150 [Planctomycetota bacterium]|nr:MAG: hypothetical protein COA79_23150 [Planctomycetota bacterium]